MRMTDLISKKDLIEALGDENFLKYAEQEQLFLFASEGDLLAIVGGIKDLISSAPVVNLPINVNLDVIRDSREFIPDIDGNLMALIHGDMGYEETGIKVNMTGWNAESPQPQSAKDALEKQGLAIVPMRLTKEMKAIFSEEEWEWKDLLAAAEAITEQQYSALIEHDAPSAPTNLKIRRSEL